MLQLTKLSILIKNINTIANKKQNIIADKIVNADKKQNNRANKIINNKLDKTKRLEINKIIK